MRDDYQPELGQALFGNATQALSCPVEIECIMSSLREAFDVLHPKLDNPFSNTGSRFRWSCFTAHSYDWCDEEQPWNFKWRDFEVSWYKHCTRGLSRNRKLSRGELREMMRECMMAMASEKPEDCRAA